MPRPTRRLLATGVALAAVTLTPALVGPADAGLNAAGLTDTFRPQLVQVQTPTRADKARLQATGLDLTEHAGHDYVEVVLHDVADLSRLRALGLSYVVRIADLVRREAQVNRTNEEYAARVARSALPSGRDSYRTLADYNTEMAALAKRHPSLVRGVTLPLRSLDGKAVKGIEIGRDVRAAADGRPTFVILGLHHAREWPSGELTMEFAYDLVKSYGKKARITRLLNKARVIAVPVVNVDGFDRSRTDGALIDLGSVLNPLDPLLGTLLTPGNAYKRKNCRVIDGVDTPDGTCILAAASPGGFGLGVDPNRNYGGYWGGPGASDIPIMQDYRGAGAFSEPETENIRRLVSGRQVTTLITNHTFSNLVLRPNGVHPDTVGPDGKPVGNAYDERALKALGDRMAAQNGYKSQHGWQLYDTTGTTEDWSYNATGGYGYTFEIGAHEFHPPYPQVVDEYLGAGKYAGRGNREAYLIALENAVNPTHHSVIRGQAPAGATLRITKSFKTPTWTSTINDRLTSTLRVPASGRYVWHVNPSTRPTVSAAGRTESWTLTCSVGGKVRATKRITVDRGEIVTPDLAGC
ncbi:M14 family zinc carboxypeptidase [Nocardioides speluncae]|uniref:M14 family zinc carboxypeptidase n=1 Tax=Nocardioides speluncae TaxID=2670337 RepID=UPI000D69925E|nr:M14 family zinc carboxypeptidase [Nocardioides speluncae]